MSPPASFMIVRLCTGGGSPGRAVAQDLLQDSLKSEQAHRMISGASLLRTPDDIYGVAVEVLPAFTPEDLAAAILAPGQLAVRVADPAPPYCR
jgi:hypothetical protein